MLSEAKYLRLFSPDSVPSEKNQGLKALPRGLRPLRCSFASLRMTLSWFSRHLIIRHSFMLRHSLFIRHSCFVIVFALGMGNALAEKRAITEKDLWDFVWIGDPQVSPDGSRVAFVRVTVNEKKEGYNTSIWTVPLAGGEEPHQLTKGDHDSTPRWSPDGKFLLFLRASEKDGKPEPPQLGLLPIAGGDSFVFTDLPKGAGNPSWAPDGRTIAFTSDTNAEDLAKQAKKKHEEESKKTGGGNAPAGAAEHETDVRVITHAVYRQDKESHIPPQNP